MLIIADLSGIQDFLFDVQDEGGGQAASLRFRSLRIQLIAEVVAARLRQAAGLGEDRLLFCVAGKVALDGTGVSDARLEALQAEKVAVEHWLMQQTHGRLRLSVAISKAEGNDAKRHEAAMKAQVREKLRTWAPAAGEGWGPMVSTEPFNRNAEAERDTHWGDRLRKEAAWLVGTMDYAKSGSHSPAEDVVGVRLTTQDHEPRSGDAIVKRDLRALARHIPRHADNKPVEFVELASRAGGGRGMPMLGVLKADADSLGAAVRSLLASKGFAGMKALSQKLEQFFGKELNRLMDQPPAGKPWGDLYTVFAGGDDLLLVGPWDTVLDFAGELQSRFAQGFGQSAKGRDHAPLTLSAGVAIVKPKFPIRLAAEQAEELLHEAKSCTAKGATAPKDQIACLGGLWKWPAHAAVISAGRQLAQWVDEGIIQRNWLHTLLELAILRRTELAPLRTAPTDMQTRLSHVIAPAMATSRLAYHVARNWPTIRPNPRDAKERASNDAREWIDRIYQQFDRFESATDSSTLHLPSIVRYAMLATRSNPDKE